MTIEEKLTKIAEDMPKVYEAGVEEGKNSAYSDFWDAVQDKGNRTIYTRAFDNKSWNNIVFKPKYDMYPTEAQRMFYGSGIEGDFVEILDQLDVKLDFSNCTNIANLFQNNGGITRVGVIDTSSITGTASWVWGNVFYNCPKLVTIDKIIVTENSTSFNQMFNLCPSLINVTFEGVIAKNGLNLSWSTKLSRASIESIINTLSATTSGLSITLSKTAVNTAFETTEGLNDGSTSAEWLALIATKNNWTISLA